MLEVAMCTTILSLWKNGLSKKEISRLTKKDIKTVRKVIKKHESGLPVNVYKDRGSALDNYKSEILGFLEKGLTGVRIHEELRPLGYSGSYPSVINYIRNFKGSNNICIRFHTLPGEEAQVDYGEVTRQPNSDNKVQRCWIFNMRLSYSRLDYYEIVFGQKVESFIRCHMNAFKYFGGIPKIVKIDNLKSGIINANFYEPIYQSLYKSFAEHYGFAPVPCRVRKPQEKGKVESGVKYAQQNFFLGRRFSEHIDLQSQFRDWLDNKCNIRIHGTTKRIPRELFNKEEKAHLKPLPVSDFLFPEIGIRKVGTDCHVTVGNNYYSVPYEYVGKEVSIQVSAQVVTVLFADKIITSHLKCHGKGEFVTKDEHYPKRKLYYPGTSEYKNDRRHKMQSIGKNALIFFETLLEDKPTDWYRTVDGIISLDKLYSSHVVDLSCKRAMEFNITKYSQIKNICKSGCYALSDNNNNYNVENIYEYA